MPPMTSLPIQDILAPIQDALIQHSRLIVMAPPGAGKSTLLPLHLLDASWLKDKQIWLLEPRRLAAEMVARRLANSLNEELGGTIGLMTGEFSKVSTSNKLVVMTEGILSQRLLTENDIPKCAAILFDEFHERNVQTDLGLALAVQCQDYLRDDLKIILMSATLDSDALQTALKAEVLISEGRSFKVDVHYLPPKLIRNQAPFLSQQVNQAIIHALKTERGDILVFLPGVKEIRQCQTLLQDRESSQLKIVPLHGQLNWQQQQEALKSDGPQKIILATDIAKTSLTLTQVTVVIDSGLERQAQFNSRQQMDELITIKASQASAIQRTGRAGRVQAGICYRLYSETDFLARAPFSEKSIELCDSAQIAVNLASWGSLDLSDYFLLDQPNPKRWENSLALLEQLNITHDASLTPHGKIISQLPLHPRFAHMIIMAKPLKLAYTACYVAAILSEGDPLHFDFQTGHHCDLELRLQLFQGSSIPHRFAQAQVNHKVALRIKKLAQKLMGQLHIKSHAQTLDEHSAGLLTMLAYPERVAQLRGKGYRLRSGQGCQLLPNEAIHLSDFLAVAHISANKQHGQASGQNFVRLAASVTLQDIETLFKHDYKTSNIFELTPQNKLQCINQTHLGALLLSEKAKAASSDQTLQYKLQRIKEKGLGELAFKKADHALLARLNLAHQYFPQRYPSFASPVLVGELDNWLVPFVNLGALEKVDLSQALLSRLEWSLQNQLKQDFPETYTLPTGRHASINYNETPPVIRAKLQECFGLAQSPTVAQGRLTLNLHLLSPAQRPLAMTQDLAFFWQEAYPQVRKESRGRYAKHPWPEDPLSATASILTKRRLNDAQ
jgi:ATP-dependent helicase HrpB